MTVPTDKNKIYNLKKAIANQTKVSKLYFKTKVEYKQKQITNKPLLMGGSILLT